jgi:tryptophan-rich sensory protein
MVIPDVIGSMHFSPAPIARSKSSNVAGLIAWVALSFAAAATGAWIGPGEWYAGLNKPSWNPPGWLFGPVWTTLYTLMGIAAWRVWSRRGWRAPGRPLAWFLVQLALNAAWTPLFFGLKNPGVALVCIVMMVVAIAATIRAFFKSGESLAAMLLAPYLAWTSFATFLNFTLWRMNG